MRLSCTQCVAPFIDLILTLSSYLSADYERETFNVSACTWIEGAKENIVTIPSKDSDDSPTSSDRGGSSSLSNGAIAGIVIGAVVLALIVAAVIVLIIRRQRKKSSYRMFKPSPDDSVITGPVHNAPLTPGAKYHSPDSIGNTTAAASYGESNAESSNGGRPVNASGQDSNGRVTNATSDPSEPELDGDSQQIYQLHGESRPPPPESDEAPIYHELGGSEVTKKPESDRVYTVGTLPPGARGEIGTGDEPPSPYVSTMGTTGWHDDAGDASSDLVSPTTPVLRRNRLPPTSDPAD